ncbi:LEA type 2 family protein [Halosegnis marinus]|uniref:LEA type 2 family protein n=1 Tax=Halosegnis marinus TaxID=3034023 RepID=A0ABD5ZRT6_9EURY|nr:LEA type 2 family protein [Halosegnis sp. DT85]
MDVRALLLGSKLKVAATAFGLLVASVGGAFALGVVGVPGVAGVSNSFGDVTDETTVVNTDLLVTNPNPIGVRLGGTDIDYTIRMNDVAIAAGNKSGVGIESGNTTLNFSTRMDNRKIPAWWASHVRNDETTNVTIDANVTASILGGRNFALQQRQQVNTDIISQFNSNETRPVSGPSNPLYENPVLYVNATRASWGTVTADETPIDMRFDVYNPQLEPYTLTEVGYVVTMNNVTVGEGVTDEPYVVEGGTRETIRTVPVIRNQRLDEWWVSHLENGQVTDLRIDFYARVELPTGNSLRIPLDALTYERTIETDIFGTKNATNTTDTGGSATPTPTDGDGTATPTPTDDGGLVDTPTVGTDEDTATPTSSPTATPTDDGGII